MRGLAGSRRPTILPTMKRAIIIVDHGSRVAEANRVLEELADLLRTLTPDRVYPAHMELAEPSIGQAFAAAARDGADHVFVFPYFLTPGRHSVDDIPRMCAEAAAGFPTLKYHCADPIGLERQLAELIVHRVEACPEQAYDAPR